MSNNPSKDILRQPLPQGGEQSSLQDLANQSFDPTFRTFIHEVVGSPDGTNLYKQHVNADGSIPTTSGLIPFAYDSISYTSTSPSVDTYTYQSLGNTVATVTLTYTDSSKTQISSIART